MTKLLFLSALSGFLFLAQSPLHAQTSLNPKDWWNNMKAAAKQKKDSIVNAKKNSVANTTQPTSIFNTAQPSGAANNNSTDAVTFQIDGCTGNSAAQTVTVFFTIANPVNVNQAIAVGGPAARAIDPDGNLCRPKEIHLADGNGGWIEVPTGLKIKGSITFSNILPKQTQLALMEFAIFSHNADGGRDPKKKDISVRNLNVAWQ